MVTWPSIVLMKSAHCACVENDLPLIDSIFIPTLNSVLANRLSGLIPAMWTADSSFFAKMSMPSFVSCDCLVATAVVVTFDRPIMKAVRH